MGPGRPIQARPIDMGLPSGVQWASCNVGAASPSDLGLFFSWGNTEGHMINEGYDFSQAVYDSTPGENIATDLSLEQDAARTNLGEPWRMPTSIEFQELIDNCTIEWSTLDGVAGSLFTSNVNGNRVFFPAAGNYNGTSLIDRGTVGDYWSSSYESATTARRLYFNSSTVNTQLVASRYRGFSVRAVMNTV